MHSLPPPLPGPFSARSGESRRREKKPVRPDLCAAINWLAFPGLGTILAGGRWGYAQAGVMLVGFALFVGFFLAYTRDFYLMFQTGNIIERPAEAARWMGWWGGGLCLFAWVWAAVDSLRILAQKPKPPLE